MTNITINPVRPTDAAFLTELMNHPAILRRLHQTPTTVDDWSEAIALWLSDDDEEGYILFDRDRPMGWFAFNALLSPKPYLKIAVLLPEYQGQGIGQFALTHLLEKIKNAGYASVSLFTDCDNLRAQSCYQKCGFRILAEAEESWPDGSIARQYEMEAIL